MSAQPQALTVQPAPAQLAWFTPEQVRERVNLVQKLYRELMQKDMHYGTIPGTKKPTLYKAGSEMLLTTFKIGIKPTIEDLSDDGEIRYRVTCEAFSIPTGTFLGAGIGECSSLESKYKWREAVCGEEWDDFHPSDRRVKYRRNGTVEQQVRQEAADVANTVLKMAKKRAQIDATLTVTGCSDIFTQDLEDLEHPATAIGAEEGGGAPSTEELDDANLISVCNKHGKFKGLECPGCAGKDAASGQHAAAAEESGASPANGARGKAAPASSVGQARPSVSQDGPVISEKQSGRFFAIWKNAGLTQNEVKGELKRRFGITDDRQIPAGKPYDDICAWAERGGR